MSTPMASLTATPVDIPPQSGPRRLDDDVFQTAEEAVLVEGQGSAAGLSPGESVTADSRRDAREAGLSGSHGVPFVQRVRTYVAEKPCQSALMAAAAGALAMMVLRSQLRGRLTLPRSLRPR
jgi:hypothetical protein